MMLMRMFMDLCVICVMILLEQGNRDRELKMEVK